MTDEQDPCICKHGPEMHVGLPGFFSCLICGGTRHVYMTETQFRDQMAEQAYEDARAEAAYAEYIADSAVQA